MVNKNTEHSFNYSLKHARSKQIVNIKIFYIEYYTEEYYTEYLYDWKISYLIFMHLFSIILFNFNLSVILINITDFLLLMRLLHVAHIVYKLLMFACSAQSIVNERHRWSESKRFSFARGTCLSWCQGSQVSRTYAFTVDEVLFVCAKDRLANYSTVTKWQIPAGNRFQHLLWDAITRL